MDNQSKGINGFVGDVVRHLVRRGPPWEDGEPEKVAYLFGKDVNDSGRVHTQFVISDGGMGYGNGALGTVSHYRSLREKGVRVIDNALPEGFPATDGFRLLTKEDWGELREQEWEFDHPGLFPEEGKLIDKIKAQGVKKEGLLWVFEFPKIPKWMEEMPYEVHERCYFLSENDGQPYGVRIWLSQFVGMLKYFGEVCNFRNTLQNQAEGFRQVGLDQNPDMYEAKEFFQKNPPTARPLNQNEVGQLSQGGIEVLLATAQPQ
jgi:hypothetical protein